jgi:hypothetical protein
MKAYLTRSAAVFLLACSGLIPLGTAAADKQPDGGEAKEPFSTLAKETLAKAKENPDLAEILALRGELDELLHEYRACALTKGVKAHSQAIRKLPPLVRRAEKVQAKLGDLTDRLLKPVEKELAKTKEREAKTLRQLEKLQERGRQDRIDEAGKEADELRAKIEKDTQTAELIREVGMPTARFSPPEELLLLELMDLNEQEEKSLQSLLKKDSNLIAGRLMILHLEADLKAAQDGTDGEPPNPERADAIVRQLKQVNRKFAKYFLDLWEPIAERAGNLTKEKEALADKVDALGDKPAARKYQQELSTVSNQLQGMQRSTSLYRKIVRGTLAEKKLAELAEQAKGQEDEAGDRRRSRRD